jgi:hypothetical protein
MHPYLCGDGHRPRLDDLLHHLKGHLDVVHEGLKLDHLADRV